MKARALKELLERVSDDAEIVTVGPYKNLKFVKHAHLVTYKDGSGGEMVAICAMGDHLSDTEIHLHDGAS